MLDFNDGNTSGDDYTYDANGNLTADNNKGITKIKYNHLNLPTNVTSRYTGTIDYIYDANGMKLAKEFSQRIGTTTTEYAGNYVYEKFRNSASKLQFLNQPEGYIEPKNENNLNEGFKYVYQYKDHLGNIRLSYSDENGDGIVNKNEIREEKNYYPFGLTHKGYNNTVRGRKHNYGYNGVEENDELGLATLDFGWRNYSPDLGRWMNVDPLAEEREWLSPYNFVQNNPINRIDPDGALDMGVQSPDTWLLNAETGDATYIDDGSDDIVVLGGNNYNSAVTAGTKAYECPGECDNSAYNSYQGLLSNGVRATTNKHGMVELPHDTDTQNGQFTFGGEVLYKHHKRNDMSFGGIIEQDQWGAPENITKFMSLAIKAKNQLGMVMSFGDLSTETGNSPRYNSSGKRHATHYNGSQADMKYFNRSGVFGGNSGHMRADKGMIQTFTNIANGLGMNHVRFGLSLKGKVMGRGLYFDYGHRHHIHVGFGNGRKK